jgi:hypothetical protein
VVEFNIYLHWDGKRLVLVLEFWEIGALAFHYPL